MISVAALILCIVIILLLLRVNIVKEIEKLRELVRIIGDGDPRNLSISGRVKSFQYLVKVLI